MEMEMEPSSAMDAEAAADVAVRNLLARELPTTDADDDAGGDDADLGFGRGSSRGGNDDSFDIDGGLSSHVSDDDAADIEKILADDDPEPIPDVFSGPKPGLEGGKRSRVLLWLVVVLVVLGGTGGGIWYKRAEIVEMFPQAAAVFEALNIPTPSSTSMLQVKDIVADRFVQNGADILVVKGIITNTSEQPRPVPMLRLGLYDAANALIQETSGKALSETLAPGDSTRFTIQLEHPSLSAHHFEIGYVTP